MAKIPRISLKKTYGAGDRAGIGLRHLQSKAGLSVKQLEVFCSKARLSALQKILTQLGIKDKKTMARVKALVIQVNGISRLEKGQAQQPLEEIFFEFREIFGKNLSTFFDLLERGTAEKIIEFAEKAKQSNQ